MTVSLYLPFPEYFTFGTHRDPRPCNRRHGLCGWSGVYVWRSRRPPVYE